MKSQKRFQDMPRFKFSPFWLGSSRFYPAV
jgi:hypothetical protein